MARFGLAKTTVDDVARRAGLSRATLYRLFPGGRDEIVAATVRHEVRSYFAGLAADLSDLEELEELLVVALQRAADGIVRHAALGFLLAHEPETVLPYLSFQGFNEVLAAAGGFLAPYLSAWLEPAEGQRVGEWLARLVLSYVACPGGAGLAPGELLHSGRRQEGEAPFALHPEPIGEELARRLVQRFVLPGIEVLGERSRKEP